MSNINFLGLCIYSHNFDGDRMVLWEELAGLCNRSNLPLFIEGYFNISRFPSERSGKARFSPTMVEFSNFILQQGISIYLLTDYLFS